MMRLTSTQNIRYFFAIVLVLYFVFVIVNPAGLYFLNDDFVHIPLSRTQVWIHFNFFRPIANLFTALDCFLWDRYAPGFHFTSLLLHIGASLSVYFLSNIFCEKYYPSEYSREISFISALLFFTYPFHAEPVMWVIGRIVIIAAICVIWSLFFYLQRNQSSLKYGLSIIFFILGLFTYESAWVLPIFVSIISATDVYKKHSSWRKEVKWLAGYCVIFLVYQLLRFFTIGPLGGFYAMNDDRQIRVISVFSNGIKLILRSFVPPFFHSSQFIIACIIFLIVAGFFFVRLVRKKRISFGIILLSVLALIAYLPVVIIGIDTHDTEGERFLYLPSVFWLICLGIFIKESAENLKQMYVVSVILLGVFLFLFNQSAGVYRQASMVTRLTMETLSKCDAGKNIYLVNLPTQYKGGLIFRMGVEDGVAWILPQHNKNNVYVVSSREMMKVSKNFAFNDGYYGDSLKNNLSERNIIDEVKLFKRSKGLPDRNDEADWVLAFTDSSIVRIKGMNTNFVR